MFPFEFTYIAKAFGREVEERRELLDDVPPRMKLLPVLSVSDAVILVIASVAP